MMRKETWFTDAMGGRPSTPVSPLLWSAALVLVAGAASGFSPGAAAAATHASETAATPDSTATHDPGAPVEKIHASLRETFGDDTSIEAVPVDSSLVYRVTGDETVLGYAKVSNVKGKDQPITYLVAIDPEGRLVEVDILVYREAYGGEVDQSAWRKQFRGKTAGDRMRVGKEIRNISGATISAHAVTAGVRSTLEKLSAWLQEGRLN